MKFLNIAFYKFVTVADPYALRDQLRAFCATLGTRGTILISEEGINACVAGPEADIRRLQAHLDALPGFDKLPYKESWSDDLPFSRMLVKKKKELITMGVPEVRPHEKTGKRILPSELKQWLDENKDLILIDTRNDYEVGFGTFKNALNLHLKSFRQFPQKLKDLPQEDLKNKPVVMFCTGGIRCEKATALALDLGVENVYQLDGGILKYFEECGGSHYDGECFVFDNRVAVDPELKHTRKIEPLKGLQRWQNDFSETG